MVWLSVVAAGFLVFVIWLFLLPQILKKGKKENPEALGSALEEMRRKMPDYDFQKMYGELKNINVKNSEEHSEEKILENRLPLER